jgi:undecaprenyl-diphosphatase
MGIFEALILSIVEGLTEFLPVSSTGHLILTSHLLQLPQTEFLKSFEIIIQLGAILAVVVLYFKRLLQAKLIWRPLAIAFIPSAVAGLLLYKFIKAYLLNNDTIVVVSLILGGIVLILVDKFLFAENKNTTTIEQLSTKQAVAVGLGQALAIIPGVSRSGATIVAGVAAGMNKQSAVEFSFLLAVPTMLAATTLDIVQSAHNFSANEFTLLAIGLVGAFLTALAAVKLFINYVQKHSFAVFGYYRIAIGILYLLLIR